MRRCLNSWNTPLKELLTIRTRLKEFLLLLPLASSNPSTCNESSSASLGSRESAQPRSHITESMLTDYQPRDDVYGAYDHSHFQTQGPNQHTQSPIVTGTSVVAAKFKDGVVIAADNLGMSLMQHTWPVTSLLTR
jgi:hypothetical protein